MNRQAFTNAVILLLCLIEMQPDHSEAAPLLISHLKWGRVRVSNMDSSYRDAKIWPGGSQEWDWRVTNTHHNPGVQVADVKDLFQRAGDSLEYIVLSRGMDSVLQVPDSTVKYAQSKGATVHVLPTEQAVKLYNKLASEGKRVAGLFHSTC